MATEWTPVVPMHVRDGIEDVLGSAVMTQSHCLS